MPSAFRVPNPGPSPAPGYYFPGAPAFAAADHGSPGAGNSRAAWPPAAPAPAVRNYPPVAAIAPPANGQPNPGSSAEPPMTPQLGRPEPAVAESSSAAAQSAATPALPAGIPQFAYVADRVASGQRPQTDGFDWLQSNGFKTVLFVRQPGEDETADRREVLKRGMKYQTITFTPQTLSRQVLDEFNRLVADPANQPIFVYDRNGVWAGSLWYLHFRTAGKMPPSEAQTRAARLGMRALDDGEQRTMWVAMQQLLSAIPQ